MSLEFYFCHNYKVTFIQGKGMWPPHLFKTSDKSHNVRKICGVGIMLQPSFENKTYHEGFLFFFLNSRMTKNYKTHKQFKEVCLAYS